MRRGDSSLGGLKRLARTNSLLYVSYETKLHRRVLARLLRWLKYGLIRPVASFAAFVVCSRQWRRNRFTTMDGRPLAPGVAFCLVAKNEEETIDACLDSLLPFVDQVVAVDNGSTDGTLERLSRFKSINQERIEVRVLQRSDTTLARSRQDAADLVSRTWFIRGDADMVFTPEFVALFRRLRQTRRPTAVLCRKLNLFGDYFHYNRVAGPVSEGEYFLRHFDRDVRYIEFDGRLEHARIPLHYRMLRPPRLAMLHVDSNKPTERIFLRTCYLDWREAANRSALPPQDFEVYKRSWLEHNFGVATGLSLRFRMARLLGKLCARHVHEEWLERAERLARSYACHYVVRYEDGEPYLRLDRRDSELLSFRPEAADAAWRPDVSRFHSDSVRTAIGRP